MGRRRLGAADERRVVDALASAERGNKGEVRLHLEGRCRGAPLVRAAEVFAELGMRETAEDTGVLLYVAESDRQAAVHAGSGVHGAREPAFWQEVIEYVAEGYRRGRKVEGLVQALEVIGDLLREVVPGDPAGNELPDEVSTR